MRLNKTMTGHLLRKTKHIIQNAEAYNPRLKLVKQ